jgi:hypothetical protein
MDEVVELERVELARVVAHEALAHVFDQPRELRLVIGADGSAGRAPLSLGRTGLRACPAAGIAGRHRLRTLLRDRRAGGRSWNGSVRAHGDHPFDGQSDAKPPQEPPDRAAAHVPG